jgi:uncharacterized DUF497 family protein
MATITVGEFEWDSRKAEANARKHGVTFEEAVTVFLDPLALDLVDDLDPDRWIVIGRSSFDRTLLVVYAERANRTILRLISARRASTHERKAYEEGS